MSGKGRATRIVVATETVAVQITAITSAFGAAIGAAFGVVLGPLLGWALMRRVPLGRAIGETAFAAAVWVGIAFVAPIWGLSVLIYPVIAATLAALRLRFSYRGRELPAGDRPFTG